MTIDERIAALAATCARISALFEELLALREKVRLAETVPLISQRLNEMGQPMVLPVSLH